MSIKSAITAFSFSYWHFHHRGEGRNVFPVSLEPTPSSLG